MSSVTKLPASPAALQAASNLRLGRPVAITDDGMVELEYHGESGGRVHCRLCAPHDRQGVLDAITEGSDAIVAAIAGSPEPIIVSFVVPPKALSREAPRQRVIEARESLVLRAGKAVITLRADGKVVISGARIFSQATDVVRLQARTVGIN